MFVPANSLQGMVPVAGHETLDCSALHPTYGHRVDDPDSYNFCTVPDTGYDVILFAGMAVALGACVTWNQYRSLVVMLTGGAVAGLILPVNTGRLGNAVAWWLGIKPYELFFYVFLPPLLLDAAVRIEFYAFKKMIVPVLGLAFAVVAGTAGLIIPIVLYAFRMESMGWNWACAALYGAMVGPTDAVAIINAMKTSGGPTRLRVILEGEALLNDASSITLFHIFFGQVQMYMAGTLPGRSAADLVSSIVKQAARLTAGGIVVGLVAGHIMQFLLWVVHFGRASHEQQVAVSLAAGYLAFYVAENPMHTSGVVAVVVFGLYGAYTHKWGMSRKTESAGAFSAFWDTACFAMNNIVFFYAGASCINFFWRSISVLKLAGNLVLLQAVGLLLGGYVAVFLLRFLLIVAVNIFHTIGKNPLNWREILFLTLGGVRGAVSLIMTQAVVNGVQPDDPILKRVKAEMALCTAGFVLLTLLVNGSIITPLLNCLRLNTVPVFVLERRQRAIDRLLEAAKESMEELRQTMQDERTLGADWMAVDRTAGPAMLRAKLASFTRSKPPPDPPALGNHPPSNTTAPSGRPLRHARSVFSSSSLLQSMCLPLSTSNLSWKVPMAGGTAEAEAEVRCTGHIREVPASPMQQTAKAGQYQMLVRRNNDGAGHEVGPRVRREVGPGVGQELAPAVGREVGPGVGSDVWTAAEGAVGTGIGTGMGPGSGTGMGTGMGTGTGAGTGIGTGIHDTNGVASSSSPDVATTGQDGRVDDGGIGSAAWTGVGTGVHGTNGLGSCSSPYVVTAGDDRISFAASGSPAKTSRSTLRVAVPLPGTTEEESEAVPIPISLARAGRSNTAATEMFSEAWGKQTVVQHMGRQENVELLMAASGEAVCRVSSSTPTRGRRHGKSRSFDEATPGSYQPASAGMPEGSNLHIAGFPLAWPDDEDDDGGASIQSQAGSPEARGPALSTNEGIHQHFHLSEAKESICQSPRMLRSRRMSGRTSSSLSPRGLLRSASDKFGDFDEPVTEDRPHRRTTSSNVVQSVVSPRQLQQFHDQPLELYCGAGHSPHRSGHSLDAGRFVYESMRKLSWANTGHTVPCTVSNAASDSGSQHHGMHGFTSADAAVHEYAAGHGREGSTAWREGPTMINVPSSIDAVTTRHARHALLAQQAGSTQAASRQHPVSSTQTQRTSLTASVSKEDLWRRLECLDSQTQPLLSDQPYHSLSDTHSSGTADQQADAFTGDTYQARQGFWQGGGYPADLHPDDFKGKQPNGHGWTAEHHRSMGRGSWLDTRRSHDVQENTEARDLLNNGFEEEAARGTSSVLDWVGDMVDVEDPGSNGYESVPQESEDGMDQSSEEDRVRDSNIRCMIASGMLQQCKHKRLLGLLSSTGVRVAQTACEMALEQPQSPLKLWSSMQRECHGLMVFMWDHLAVLTGGSMLAIAAGRQTPQQHTAIRKLCCLSRWWNSAVALLNHIALDRLTRTYLLKSELAIEYVLAINKLSTTIEVYSSQVWANEVRQDLAAAVKFLDDFEAAAPDRFSAIQTYRAMLAMLQKEQELLKLLLQDGSLDDEEYEVVAEQLNREELLLENRGLRWQDPDPWEVVVKMPFFNALTTFPGPVPAQMLKLLEEQYLPVVLERSKHWDPSQDKSLNIVCKGLVKVTYRSKQPERNRWTTKIFKMGAGSCYHAWAALGLDSWSKEIILQSVEPLEFQGGWRTVVAKIGPAAVNTFISKASEHRVCNMVKRDLYRFPCMFYMQYLAKERLHHLWQRRVRSLLAYTYRRDNGNSGKIKLKKDSCDLIDVNPHHDNGDSNYNPDELASALVESLEHALEFGIGFSRLIQLPYKQKFTLTGHMFLVKGVLEQLLPVGIHDPVHGHDMAHDSTSMWDLKHAAGVHDAAGMHEPACGPDSPRKWNHRGCNVNHGSTHGPGPGGGTGMQHPGHRCSSGGGTSMQQCAGTPEPVGGHDFPPPAALNDAAAVRWPVGGHGLAQEQGSAGSGGVHNTVFAGIREPTRGPDTSHGWSAGKSAGGDAGGSEWGISGILGTAGTGEPVGGHSSARRWKTDAPGAFHATAGIPEDASWPNLGHAQPAAGIPGFATNNIVVAPGVHDPPVYAVRQREQASIQAHVHNLSGVHDLTVLHDSAGMHGDHEDDAPSKWKVNGSGQPPPHHANITVNAGMADGGSTITVSAEDGTVSRPATNAAHSGSTTITGGNATITVKPRAAKGNTTPAINSRATHGNATGAPVAQWSSTPRKLGPAGGELHQAPAILPAWNLVMAEVDENHKLDLQYTLQVVSEEGAMLLYMEHPNTRYSALQLP